MTPEELRLYMVTILADVGETLGWHTSSGPIVEASNDVELAADLDGDQRLVRALGRLEAWKAAVSALVAFYDFRSDQEHFSRSQMLAGARSALAQAETDCMAMGVGNDATIHTVVHTDDPYVRREEVEI